MTQILGPALGQLVAIPKCGPPNPEAQENVTPPDDLVQKLQGLPHINLEVVRDSFVLATKVAEHGTGEGHPAHGFTIIVGDSERLLETDNEGNGICGECGSEYAAFFNNSVNVVKDAFGKRIVMLAFKEDGAIVIDGRTGDLVAMSFLVGDLRKGSAKGGARHKSASAISQQAGGCFVIKCSEDYCKKMQAKFDVFCNDKEPVTFQIRQ